MKDLINNPDHYTAGGIETIDFIEAKELSYGLGNAVKYISRAGRKDSELEDLKKARWYLDREIKRLEDLERATATIQVQLELPIERVIPSGNPVVITIPEIDSCKFPETLRASKPSWVLAGCGCEGCLGYLDAHDYKSDGSRKVGL